MELFDLLVFALVCVQDRFDTMNCISLNCRGCGNAATIRELDVLVKTHIPKLVFLCETRQKKDRVAKLRRRLGLSGFAGCDSEGMSGGLALFWHDSLQVEVKEITPRFIDVHVRMSTSAPLWRATFIYGEPRTDLRHRMWSTMCDLKAASDLPWFAVGDFNEALWQHEHMSACRRPENQMVAFRDTLLVCELKDLGFQGIPFTYDNGRRGNANVKVRLDRALADDRWRDIFTDASVVHLVTPCSDHCPILVKLDREAATGSVCKCRRYEIMWEREHALPEVISNAWQDCGPKSDLGEVNAALKKVMDVLQTWGGRKFGNVTRELARLRKKLENLRRDNAPACDIREAMDAMNELLYREEMLWLQRSRISWLKEGDRNTKFFHRKAVWRARKNRITALKDQDGVVQHAPTEMEHMATSYFQSVYTRDPTILPTPVVNLFEEVITDDLNENLCKQFSEEEISDALFQIGPLKAPGPDGFPARFYQKNWGVLKEEIVHAVLQFFDTGQMPEGINDTSIVLIPKIDNPMELKDYRPISLCNVLYKIISKCLVNRLRPILGDIISENQSAFVPGRLITDNALLAFECLYYMEHGVSANNSFCAYKLDLSKAYDRVDWVFLEEVMHKMGFSHRWIQWIMRCVTTVRYSVKFNGGLLEAFSPTRGLRQGDPLSPFLFLFVADGLSALLQSEISTGGISPIKVCRRAPGISHLLFADDTLLFFKADCGQAQRVKHVIDNYAAATGQLINPSKCSIFFSPQCDGNVQDDIRNILQVQRDNFEDKYLGLPTPEGRMNKGKFDNLQSKLSKRLLQWGDLSQGGKEIMIKAVAQALTTYIMGVFKLPLSVCDDLTKLIRNFWWGAERGKRKTHWVSWDMMIRSKPHGGMGFRDMRIFNQALLARQAWRLISRPDSLCARVLRAKYYPQGNLVDTVFTGNPSPTWTAIVHGLELLKHGLIWRVGDGRSIRIWRDNWIPRATEFKVIGPRGRSRLNRVSSLLDEHGTWDEALVRRTFPPIDADVILRIKTSARCPEDFLAWQPEKNGVFSVRSAYRIGLQLAQQDQVVGASSTAAQGDKPIWKKIWSCNIPEKVRIFAWKALSNALATEDNKIRHHMPVSGLCRICGAEREDTHHALIQCPHAHALWEAMRDVWPIPRIATPIRDDWLEAWLLPLHPVMCGRILMIAWRAWYARNEITHDKALPGIEGSRRFICSYLQSLENIMRMTPDEIIKGKQASVVQPSDGPKPQVQLSARDAWTRPSNGAIKLNVDGAYIPQTGVAGAGMILRRGDGSIIFSACRAIRFCSSALDSELSACMKGIKMALELSQENIIVETDSLELVTMATSVDRDSSCLGHLVADLRLLLTCPRILAFNKIPRGQNNASHELARFGMFQNRTEVWLGTAPEALLSCILRDCNNTTI